MHLASPLSAFLSVSGVAATVLAVYFLWFAAFEYLLEPVVRRCFGLALRCPIVWAVAGPLRIWVPARPCDLDREAAITAFGGAVVMSSALVPPVVVGLATGNGACDAALGATTSLMVVPMIALFLVRLMAAR